MASASSSTAAPFAGVTASPATPSPLGPSLVPGSQKKGAHATGTVNFALHSPAASSIILVLLDPTTRTPAAEFPCTRLTPDGVWGVSLAKLPLAGVGYAFRADGPPSPTTRWSPDTLLLDPRAPLVDCGRPTFGERSPTEGFRPGGPGTPFIGSFDFASPPFDWGKDATPAVPEEDLIIYEVGVRPFTASGGWEIGKEATAGPRGGALAGTYAGLADRAPYLAALGVTAVELLPIFEYDELEFRRFPNPRDHMTNVWGYSHVSFFAPMARFGAQGEGSGKKNGAAGFGLASAAAAGELKAAVKALHASGIKVILDVVYNHTAESDDATPYPLSWRGLDAGAFYMLNPSANPALMNFSGCGNTVAGNEPPVKALILDSLRHWVQEYRVDGFRFDLASALCRDKDGHPLEDPPLIREAAADPILKGTILIAEPWDCGGLYQVGSFPHHGAWGEWNGVFRDDVRRFVRGDPGAKRGFAARLAGSADLYAGDGPGRGLPAARSHARPAWHSINFVTAHDGFSLGDLVAYNSKHNGANGEGGRDGSDDNLSWNCGVEGATGEGSVLALRSRVARNHMLALFLAAGTPMLVSGDEYLSTHGGNNNWYGHDTPLAWFDWGSGGAAGEGGAAFTRFVSCLASLRRSHPLLGGSHRWTAEDVTWHEDHWDNDESRFLAFELHPRGEKTGGERLFAAFNSHGHAIPVPLPPGRAWARIVDTNLPSPRDFTPGGNAGVDPPTYMMEGNSAILLVSRG